MNKDWTGNKAATFVTLGASNHSKGERAENDYYATDPKAVRMLLEKEKFNPYIWECACGEGHISEELKEHGYNVLSTDLVDRGYGDVKDFFSFNAQLRDKVDIITNPPYKYAKEWVEHSLELLEEGNKLALFLPIQFLESESRRKLFTETPPKTVYVCVNRVQCGRNGNFYCKDKEGNIIYNKNGQPKLMSSARCYAWFVWIKGYKGDTKIKWIN